MEFKFKGINNDLWDGISILSEELNFEVSNAGILINVEKSSGNIEVCMENNKGLIKYDQKIHFFRALGLFIEEVQKRNSFIIEEKPQFSLNGAMFDVSRNAVLKVDSLKTLIRKIAIMGLNMVMLYAEDTYTIDSKPYFGYMRGRYSYKELKEIDDYADIFGIQVIPCIQTLAHLTEALKWKYASEIKDTDDILLVGEEKTYEFIEEMILAASSPFRSRRIHIGMDEAHNLGLGKYLDKNGYKRRFDIMNSHLNKVVKIASRHGLKPMIWSDMYYRLASKTGSYYDLDGNIPIDVIESVPQNIQLVYWDYYHKDKTFYMELIKSHKQFGSNPIFAGGIWT